MSHVWGLFSHPDREMQVINRAKRNDFSPLHPPRFADGGDSGDLRLHWHYTDWLEFWRWHYPEVIWFTGLALAVLFYGVMLAGVAVMGRVIWWMARNYPQRPSLAHCMVFAGYVAAPLF